jgi:Phytanoyl-CoA dioxygenase (PhyH)
MTGEFRESTDILDNFDLLRERLKEGGYLFFRSLVPRSTVLHARLEVIAALKELGWLSPGDDPQAAVPGPEIRRDGASFGGAPLGDWWAGQEAIQRLESVHALAHTGTVVELVTGLLGEDVLVHPMKIFRVTYPGSEHPTPPHQDFPQIQGTPDTLTMWLPLGDCPTSIGGLSVLEGSRSLGLRRHVARSGAGGAGVDVELSPEDPRWVTTNYLTGDALIFHSFTIHKAAPNRGTEVRLSADYRYQAVTSPVTESSLRPFGYPDVPEWEELTVGWSTTRWCEVPGSPRVAVASDVFSDFGQPASRL